jgi:ribose transport system ATP-binding protein
MVAVAVLLLGLYTSGKSSFYLADANVTGTLALVSVLGFVAMGQTMALVVGALDLSVGPLMGFVVVVESFFLTTGADVGSQALGWALLIAVPVAIGAINWALVDLVRMNAIVATLVTFIALQALSLMLRPEAGGQFDIGLTDALTSTVGTVPIAFIVLVVAALALQWLLKRNPYGIALRAVGSDAEASRLNGVRPARMRLVGFLLCSLLASAGALLLMAQVGSGDPTAGTDYTLTSISAAVIGGASIFGGRGSFIGTITAALLVTQSIGAVQFLNLDTAWASYLPGAMTLIAVAVYSKSRQHAASAH